MTTELDPIRLIDDAGEAGALSALLRAGRDELPGDDVVARIEARVTAAISGGGGGGGSSSGGGGGSAGPSAGPGGRSAAPSAGATAGPSLSIGPIAIAPSSLALGMVIALGLAGIVALGILQSHAPLAEVGATSDAGRAIAVPGSSDAAYAGALTELAPPSVEAPTSAAVPAPARLPPPSATGEAEPPVRGTEPAGGPASSETSPEVTRAAPPPPSAAAVEPPPRTTIGEPTAEPPPLEITLVSDAQRALGTAPERALALADTAAALYPDGALAQEREMVAVSALLALGGTAEARARAARFRAHWPGSPHLRRLDVLLPPAPSAPE